MNTIKESFDKTERLCSIKLISGLFENGQVFHNALFKVVWEHSPVALPFPAQAAFSVPKRGFRLAVTRNLIKRRMRESYRKNKKLFYDHLITEEKQLVMVFIFRGSSVPDYSSIEKSMKDALNRLIINILPK